VCNIPSTASWLSWLHTDADGPGAALQIMCQFWHIWVCKTRQVSVFKHGFFHNKITIFGVIIAVLVMCLVCTPR
jgi:hypothetical protein